MEVLFGIMLIGKFKYSFTLLALGRAVIKAYHTKVIFSEHMLRFLALCKFYDSRTHGSEDDENY